MEKTNKKASKWLKKAGFLRTDDLQTIDFNASINDLASTNDASINDLETVDFHNDIEMNDVNDIDLKKASATQ